MYRFDTKLSVLKLSGNLISSSLSSHVRPLLLLYLYMHALRYVSFVHPISRVAVTFEAPSICNILLPTLTAKQMSKSKSSGLNADGQRTLRLKSLRRCAPAMTVALSG